MEFGLGGYERRGALVVGEGLAESAEEFRVPRPYSTPSSSRSGCPMAEQRAARAARHAAECGPCCPGGAPATPGRPVRSRRRSRDRQWVPARRSPGDCGLLPHAVIGLWGVYLLVSGGCRSVSAASMVRWT